ncbi:MAG: NUDIX domain-containing protein [Candidatus Paceibacterota bacterium]
MEMLDILNEDGSPTRKQVSKKEAHEKGLWHRATHIWFVNSNKEILIQKRAAHIESYPGEYDISAAGHLSAGDSPIDGALREVEEELGVKLSPNELIKIGELSNQSTQHNGKYINNEWNDIYVVKKDIPIKDFIIQEDEVELVKYVPLKEFKEWVESGGENLVMHTEEFNLLFNYLKNN